MSSYLHLFILVGSNLKQEWFEVCYNLVLWQEEGILSKTAYASLPNKVVVGRNCRDDAVGEGIEETH